MFTSFFPILKKNSVLIIYFRQGQANHFTRAAPEVIPWGIQRYVGETERLYGILNTRLSDRDYVVGPQRGKFSIVDIALLGWANGLPNLSVDVEGKFPNVKAWLERCFERPAVKAGFEVPKPPAQGVLYAPDEQQKVKNAEIAKTVAAAQEKYNYKYQSP